MRAVGADVLRVGCAGWNLPRQDWPEFPPEGSHLERYAARLNAAEINSSFYRPHQPATYARWAESVGEDFRFSVKLPKTVTHEHRLVETQALMETFLSQVTALGPRLGCLLVQLPPSLAFEAKVVSAFFHELRRSYTGAVALEVRHASWFNAGVDDLLSQFQVARVLADPVLHDGGRWPGGWPGLVYCRLHGSPRMYYSAYSDEVLGALARRMQLAQKEGAQVWCIFDNTASGAAVPDALRLMRQLR
ncbi:MAG: DUF72 domain-containing protein [Comamonadaceae bacterium]|nr:MAG: DUF72 domain-containing protein [Comamonadaceae bacterium]